ncbi:MAG: DUF6478 family protein [Paracoccaceae bacterium]
MAGRLTSLFDTFTERRAMRRWANAAAEAERLDLGSLRSLRGRARAVRREIDRLLTVAETRLAVSGDGPPRPLHSDWAWRPDVFCVPIRPAGRAAVGTRTAAGADVTVFHDCKLSELTLRQIRNPGDGALPPFALSLDVLGFDGTFLSLAVDLPETVAKSLRLRHVVRVDLSVRTEKPIEIFARLNIRHGPNTEQIVRELSPEAGAAVAEFDLAYTKLNEKRIEKAWLDVIFEGPAFNAVRLNDLTLSRRPRAEV